MTVVELEDPRVTIARLRAQNLQLWAAVRVLYDAHVVVEPATVEGADRQTEAMAVALSCLPASLQRELSSSAIPGFGATVGGAPEAVPGARGDAKERADG